MQFLASGKPSDHPKADDLRNKNTVGRSHAFRANMDCISEAGFRMRKAFFTAKVRRRAVPLPQMPLPCPPPRPDRRSQQARYPTPDDAGHGRVHAEGRGA